VSAGWLEMIFCRAMERGFGRRGVSGIAVLAAVAGAVFFAGRCEALEFVGAKLDLEPFFAARAKGEKAPLPLFGEMVAADLTGGGDREIVVPGSDGKIRIFKLAGSARRPSLRFWAEVETRVEGDRPGGMCYLTAAPLGPEAHESLVLALPRGIFRVELKGGGRPKPEFFPLCDRTFFDAQGPKALPRRLDFVVDLDGDGTPELWMPELEGVAFWRKKGEGAVWDRIELPRLDVRVAQAAGAARVGGRGSVQRPTYSLRFAKSSRLPTFQVADLDSDGHLELVVLSGETAGGRSIERAECYRLRDPLHFTTAPVQVRSARAGSGDEMFLDLNGDGYLDLLRVESNLDIVKPRTVIEIFISPPVADYTFDRPTFRYATHDPIGMVLYGDWNGDGKVDIAYTQFDYAFGSTDDLVDLILGREFEITMCYLFGGAAGYSRKPDHDVALRIRNRCFHYTVFPPVSMEGDYDGDGTADLLVRYRPNRCRVFLSRRARGAKWAAPSGRPAASFSIPARGLCRIVDLNGDGRSDLLLADPEKSVLQVLLARP